MGVKGGVGCSLLTSLLSRIEAKSTSKMIAVIGSTPSNYSQLPAYLSIQASTHTLGQILPYQDRLTSKMIESYFSKSPEGVAYIPIHSNDEEFFPPDKIFPLIQKINQWFEEIFLDLSSFPTNQHFELISKSHRVFIISSLEAAALAAIKQWEKRLLPLHLHNNHIGLFFNQVNQNRTFPKDIGTWAPNLNYVGTVPFLGESLSIGLIEAKALDLDLEKTLKPLVEKILFSEDFLQQIETHEINPDNENASKEKTSTFDSGQVQQLHKKLLEQLQNSGVVSDTKKNEFPNKQALEPAAREILDRLIADINIQNRDLKQRLVNETLNLAFGLGPLEPLLRNDEISEIMVNGPQQIFVEKKGLLEKTNVQFQDEQQLRTIIERILAPIGRRIDESQPYVDGRLLDGSRVNAIIPPLSLNGPILTVRKFSKKKLQVEDLVRFGSLTPEAADFLGACVKAKKNIVVAGGTGSGKTTLLNILSNFIPSQERIVTIEDSAELQLSQEHVVRLESRPANLEGKGQVAIRDLVINALRMRPDRIVVGECRGGETLDMLQAMNTGHDGSLTTAHANSPRDVLSRLETMCLFTGLDLPIKAIREQISRAVHLIVQQNRLSNGKRMITQISQIQGMEGDVIIIQDVFNYDEGVGLVRKPFPPSFIGDLNSVGYQWPGRAERVNN